MSVDLFEHEQRVLDDAQGRVRFMEEHDVFGREFFEELTDEYTKLTKEYGLLLKDTRRGVHYADKTTLDLYEINLDLSNKVHLDPLTGIYNRRFMEENLIRVINAMSRFGKGEISVLMVALDEFEKFYDTRGHHEGDACMKAVAHAIAVSAMRPGDFTMRSGDEEFTAVLLNTDEAGAVEVAERILGNVMALNITNKQNKPFGIVTVSVGVTTGHASTAQNITAYLQRADEALYMSKQKGGNCHTCLSFEEEADKQ